MLRVVSGIVAIVAIASPAFAQPKPSPTAKYRSLYERGQRLSADGDWAGAREAFLAAYALEHRPINLYNVATTYWHERDLEHARAYYERFLDEASRDDPQVPLATERLTEVRLALAAPVTPETHDTPAAVEAPPRSSGQDYPREVIARPATLVAGMAEIVAGVGVMPRFAAASTGAIDTTYDPAAIVGLGVGATSWLELRGEIDADVRHARGSLASLGAAVAIAHGTVTAAIAASLRYELDTPGPYDASLGVPLRIRLSSTLALISSDNAFVLTLDGDRHRLLFRLPVGVAYQLTESVYAWLGTQLVVSDLRAGSLDVLIGDYAFVEGGVTYASSRSLDLGLDVRASDVGAYGSVTARLRL